MTTGKTYTAIITGDVIQSRSVNPDHWLTVLKNTLALEGGCPAVWDIYRGDSFQVEVENPPDALETAVRIKANMKSIRNMDVRMAIGIGEKDYTGASISESNGAAFVNSGEKLEVLKKEKQNLAVRSPWPDFDREINLCIRFALIPMDKWSTAAATLIKTLIEHPEDTQTQLAARLQITQSAVSGRLNRAFYPEVLELVSLFRERVHKMIAASP